MGRVSSDVSVWRRYCFDSLTDLRIFACIEWIIIFLLKKCVSQRKPRTIATILRDYRNRIRKRVIIRNSSRLTSISINTNLPSSPVSQDVLVSPPSMIPEGAVDPPTAPLPILDCACAVTDQIWNSNSLNLINSVMYSPTPRSVAAISA